MPSSASTDDASERPLARNITAAFFLDPTKRTKYGCLVVANITAAESSILIARLFERVRVHGWEWSRPQLAAAPMPESEGTTVAVISHSHSENALQIVSKLVGQWTGESVCVVRRPTGEEAAAKLAAAVKRARMESADCGKDSRR